MVDGSVALEAMLISIGMMLTRPWWMARSVAEEAVLISIVMANAPVAGGSFSQAVFVSIAMLTHP